jgi:hypothetical protein
MSFALCSQGGVVVKGEQRRRRNKGCWPNVSAEMDENIIGRNG